MSADTTLPPEYAKLSTVAVEVGMARAYLQMLEDGKRERDQTVEDLRGCIDRIAAVVLYR